MGEPVVTKTDGGCEISLAVTAPTDVTVRVCGAGGRVVRHLASGMVGLDTAPEPFAAKLLRQKIAWDGKADGGAAAPPGQYKVTVGVGARARFDRFILWNPDGFGVLGAPNWAQPGAMAVGPKGELHLVQQYGVHYSVLRVFDRSGKFVRCVWPISMAKPKEQLEPFLASRMIIWPRDVAIWGATDWQGRTVPRSVSHSAFYWYGVRSHAMAIAPDGRIILTDAHVTSGTELLMIGPDGLPQRVRGKQPWLPKNSRDKLWDLAVGPEGGLYVSDKRHGIVAHLDARTLTPVHSFGYQGERKLTRPTYLIGEPKRRKVGVWDPLWALTVDKEGRVWLANPEENCIQVYRKDGRFLSSFDRVGLAKGEQQIDARQVALAANWTSGAVYLNLAAGRQRRLVKLTSPQDPKAAAEMALPRGAKRIAADGEAGLVWAVVGYSTLMRIKDLGDRFEARTLDGLASKTLAFPRVMSVDGNGRLCLTDASSNYVLSDVEGKTFGRLSWYGATGHGYSAADAEGNWYVLVNLRRRKNEIWKLSPEGKRLKIGRHDAIELQGVKELKGICVARNGDIYVAATAPVPDTPQKRRISARAYSGVDLRGGEYNFSRVDVFGPDGVLKKEGIVRIQGINDVKLDRGGSIYVIEAGTCHGAHKRRAAKLDNQRFTKFNKLMKFAPGGGVRDGKGHLWTYRGLSGVSSYTCAGECPAAQLSVDADGRVWVPDPAVYNVAAVDAAGNLMFRVGTYGNEDCRGGGGDAVIPGTRIVRDPEVPLARPFGVAVWKDSLLIADMYSHRVARCRLEYAEQKEAAFQKERPVR